MKKAATDYQGQFRKFVKQIFAGAGASPRLTTKLACESLEGRTMPAASFFAPADPAGSVNVQLVPLANVTAGTQEIVTFGVPFTRGSVTASQLSEIRVLKNGVEIPAYVDELTPWRSIGDPAIDGQYVRVARIQIPYTFTSLNPESITVQWGGPVRALNVTSMQDPRLNWHTVTSGSFVAADNVEEPDVLPVLPKEYLAEGMLDSRTDPIGNGVAETRDNPAVTDTMTFPGYTEYDSAEKNFFYTVINQNGTGGTPIDYKTQAEPWLYDRSAAMYELYFRNGFATTLREAIRSTDFYVDHLDSNGFFTLKPGDPKYSYNESLAYTYWLLGDNRMVAPISRVTHAYDGTQTHWTPNLSFWTERNSGDKLLSNEMAYEVTGNATFKNNVKTIVGDFIWHQNGAGGQLPANRIDGGLYHYGAQHDITEASSANVLIASSWMSALIVDPMVRVYGVWQDNAQIPNFIVRMGNFEKVASKTDANGQFGGTTRYPDYLMRADGTSDNRSDTDVQHAMDVGAVAAWATYFDELRGTPDASLRQLANDLYSTYDIGVNAWTSTSGGFNVSPPRRYNWEYKNSSSFSWALDGTDAPGQAGMLHFSAPTYSVVENQGMATITVTRSNGSTGAVSVDYSTSNGTGTAGSDYTATTGTLTFADGETSKTFSIPITNDSAVENMETVVLTLSNPTGGAALTSPATATLSIDSDDTTTQPITATFQQGFIGYTGTTDVDMSNQYGGNGATTTNGNQLGVYQIAGTNGYSIEGLIRFDNLGITTHATTDATVTSASLGLTVDFGTTPSTIRGYYLATPWSIDPGTDLGWLRTGAGANWNTPGALGQGTDVVAGKSFVLSSLTGTQTVSVNLDPSVVQSWIDNPNANQGILLVNETTGAVVRVDASENATAALRPKLSVSYTVAQSTFPGSFQFSKPTYSANENQGTATVTVTRTGGSQGSVSVNYSTSDGTAMAGSDYTATSGTLTFADGEMSKTFTIPIANDTLVEGDETVLLTLSNPTGGATLGNQNTAALTIASDDVAQPGTLQFSTSGYTVNENQGTATITVTRTGGSNIPVSVDYAASSGSARAGSDFTSTSGTLSFGVGETSKTFTVPIINDALVEANETVNLTLGNPTGGATLGAQSTSTLTIVSDDTSGTVAATFQQGVNGYTGTTDASITTQNAQFTGGNGLTDLTSTQMGLYQTSGTGSYTVENLIRFNNLGIPAGATVSSASLTLNLYTWTAGSTIRGYYVNTPWNGASGSNLGWIHRGTGQDWATPGAIGQGTDVIAGKSFVLSGITATGSQNITVNLDPTVVQSWIDKPSSNQGILLVNETTGAIVQVSASENAPAAVRPQLNINYTTAAAPSPGSLQFSNPTYSVNENGGTATVTVTRTGGSAGSASINYSTSNGSAMAGSDYTATSGTLTFADGETSKTFTIPIINDSLVEGNETINLTLSNPTGGATLGSQTTSTLTIVDDDVAQPGTLQFSNPTYSVNENGGTAIITVTRTGGSNVPVSVNYATSNGTATAGSDYTATSGTLNFGVGEMTKTFTVPITDDTLVEGNETINLTLSNPTGGATLGSQTTATLTVVDDDVAQPGTLQFSNPTYSINENGGTATITVTRTGGSNVPVSVNYATNNGTATSGSDYTATSGTLNFGVGETSKTITISITDDTLVEGNETVNLTLSNPSGGATLGSTATATLNIVDNDTNGQPVTVTLQQGVNGYTGTTDASITTQNAQFTGGNGITGFTDTQMGLYQTTGSGSYAVEDLIRFGNLGIPSNATVSSASVTINLENWVGSPTIRGYYVQAPWSGTPGSNNSQLGWIHRGTGQNWATPGALGQGTDVVAGKSFVLSGIKATGSQFITINLDPAIVQSWINNPSANQGILLVNETTGAIVRVNTSESATVAMRPKISVTYSVGSQTGQPGTLQFSNPTYSVSESGGTATITVTRTGGSTGAVSVNYGTSNGTATADSDYTSTSGTLNFADGETSKTFTIPITNDTLVEGNETVNLTLSSPSGGATLGGQTTATLTIQDDDVAQPGVLQFSTSGYTVNENGGTATIRVTRTGGSNVPVSVDYAASSGTATAGSDFTSTSGTLSFGVGETSKTFTVPITNDTLVEGNETINLTLSNPTGGATLGSQPTATLTIQDDDVATLQSITVTPTNPSISNGQTAQFTVTGHYSDGTTLTLSSGVSWSSSNTSIATVSSSGLASAVGVGGATITATFGSFTSSTNLTVTATANAPTLGAHTLAFFTVQDPNDTGNAITTSPINTQATGSTILALVARGRGFDFTGTNNWASTPATNVPTDNKGNGPAVQFDSTHAYIHPNENSGSAVFAWESAAGGNGQVFQVPMLSQFEITTSFVEIKNGGKVQDVAYNYAAAGSTNTSASVTTTGPATLVAFWLGDADGAPGTMVSAIPNNGFTVIDSQPGANNAVEASVATKDVSAAGTYNITWNVSPSQGGQLWLVAIQHANPVIAHPGTLQLSASNYSVNEGQGTATVTVNRTGGSDGAVSVNYSTSNGTATAGSDYTATSGTLNFAAGETSKTLTVPIADDMLVEGSETINVTLSNPTGGAALGSPATATITIVDNDSAPPTGKFTNVTNSSGVDAIVSQKLAEDPNWWMTGQHLVDLDNDGDLDLFLDAHNGTSVVALNDGHGVFTRLTTGNWPSTEIHEMYDINGDGKIDLNATYQDGGSQWWINNSTPGHVNFTPTNVTREGNSSRSQVLFDFNGDGKVDWFRSAPPGLVVDFGDGNGGFTAGSKTFTIPGTDSNNNASFLPGDFDGDGKIDLLVLVGGNYDGTPGKTLVWHNNGNGTFTDVTATSGLPANGTIVKGVGDFNQDGKLDIIAIENKSMPPVIYLNDGHGVFTKKANAIGGVAPGSLDYTSWGTAIVTDVDNDGIADIVMDGKYYLKVLRGTGGGNFSYMNTLWGIKDTAASAVDDGLCFGDIDGDGKLDIIGFNETFPSRTLNVYHNDLAPQNWLNVRPVGLAGNVGAAGAKISIFAAGTTQLLWTEQVAQYDFQVATSYYGYDQTERHFGLGNQSNVDIVVQFASGKVTRLNNVSANQTIQVLESAGS